MGIEVSINVKATGDDPQIELAHLRNLVGDIYGNGVQRTRSNEEVATLIQRITRTSGHVARILYGAVREGSEKDVSEGARFVRFSETRLMMLADALQGRDDAIRELEKIDV